MGRRTLKKPNPSLDVTGRLFNVNDLSLTWNPEKLFGRNAPLEVEVGSGKGLFIRTAAAARPDTNFLGIELAWKYAHFSAAELVKRDIENAMMLAGDGLKVFGEFIPDNSLAAVHVYFPDPWWKRRHRVRRVLREPLMRDIQRTLLPDGRLHFWTDVEEYFQASLKLLDQATDLEGPIEVQETAPEHHMDYRTHFERRTRMNNEPVYRAEFRKRP